MDKTLRWAKPADLPSAVLLRADQVIDD